MKSGIGCAAALMYLLGCASSAMASGSMESDPIELTQQPDYILNKCQGTASADEFDGTAIRSIDPGGALANALDSANIAVIMDLTVIKNITLLEGPKHGKLVEQKDNEGLVSYYYDPTPGYVGEDRAVFMADYGGKHYKIIINLKVSRGLDNELCPDESYKLEKVTSPSSGSSSYGNDFNLRTISVTFADLNGAAVGQTTGTTITIDGVIIDGVRLH